MYAVYSGEGSGDEISFTIVGGINSNLIGRLQYLIPKYYILTSQTTDNVHKPKYVTLDCNFRSHCDGGVN